MSEYPNKFNFKKSFPLIALAGLGFGLSLSVVDPIKIRDRLRAEYRAIFDNLLTNSNEKPDDD